VEVLRIVACASLNLRRSSGHHVQNARVYAHALAITLHRVGADDVELALVELYDILLRRVAEYVLPHVSEHKHGGSGDV